MLKNRKSNASGFTLVELLIVIVIIAILAVLTLVGVNGYISRANDSKAKDSAGQLRTKVEAYHSVKGNYPSLTDLKAVTSSSDTPEAALTQSITDLLATSTTVTSEKPLFYAPCTDTTKDGGTVTYWQKAGNVSIQVGDACS